MVQRSRRSQYGGITIMARKRSMNQRSMRLLWGDEDLPELRPEVPENQATTVSRTVATTSSLRAGCAKKLFQSPHAKIMTTICTIRANVEKIAIRGSKRAMGISRANLFLVRKPHRKTPMLSAAEPQPKMTIVSAGRGRGVSA